jgi:hypothetical protein
MAHYYFEIKQIISIEDFFSDQTNKYEALPSHRIQQSPCYQIIGTKKIGQNEITFYYCKLHLNIENINLSAIEHHCKFSESEKHKQEILNEIAKLNDGKGKPEFIKNSLENDHSVEPSRGVVDNHFKTHSPGPQEARVSNSEPICQQQSVQKEVKKKLTSNTTEYANKDLEDFLEGQWIKIEDGETRVLEFLRDKTQVIEKKDFNGNMTQKVQFIVIDIESDNKAEKKFEVSRRHAAKFYAEHKKGNSILEITRFGAGIKTEYQIKVPNSNRK